MFTGLTEELGTLKTAAVRAGGVRMVVGCRKVLEDLKVGDSLALNGVCQTVVDTGEDWAAVDAVGDTLTKTTLASLRPGALVNLERACRADTRLGGHLVQGHVQGVETVLGWTPNAGGWSLEVSLAPERRRFVAAEGSVTVDGISLTVAGLTDRGFRVSIIPHTRSTTTLGQAPSGTRVNLEVDLVARYLDQLSAPVRGAVNESQLTQWGYNA